MDEQKKAVTTVHEVRHNLALTQKVAVTVTAVSAPASYLRAGERLLQEQRAKQVAEQAKEKAK